MIFLYAQSGGSLTEVWRLIGPAGDMWQKGQVTLISDSVFFILVEGVRGDTANGRIALDTLVLTLEPCKIPGKVNKKLSWFYSFFFPSVNDRVSK